MHKNSLALLPIQASFVCISLLIFIAESCVGKVAYAQNASESEQSQILPRTAGLPMFPESTFGFGIYIDQPQYRTAKNYEAKHLGLSLSFDQKIRGMWSGGLQIRWSDWVGKTTSGNSKKITLAPILILSKIEAAPNLSGWIGEGPGKIIRPFATAGAGYLLFAANRGVDIAKSKLESSEEAFTLGGGFRIIFPDIFAVRFAVERWRGLKTFRFSALTYQMEIQIGDVNNR